MKSVTIIDVARVCGVDISTVSRALRGDPRVKASTASRIEETSRRLGYQPNLAARMLRSRRSHSIWFVAPDLSNALDPILVEQAGLAAVERKFDVMTSLHFGQQDVFDRLVNALGSGIADGAIINRRDIRETSALKKLLERGYPLVVIDVPIDSMNIPTVTTDQLTAAYQLSRACIEAGARSGLICCKNRNVVDRRRARGALTAFSNASISTFECDSGSIPEDMERLPGPVAILGNSQEDVLEAARRNPQLAERGIIFACFDQWIGSAYPGSAAFVAMQDCQAIATTAVGRILEILKGQNSGDMPREIDIPLKEIRRVEAE